jgi:uncharacterized protein YecE (DUF72 family)
LCIGCSGWQYRHWRGDFYPSSVPVAKWLEYYAARFNTVEINNSFYRLPAPETFTAWSRRVPPAFVYAVKASRYLTHMKKLVDPADALKLLFDGARRLGKHLGPVLYQLPPHWSQNLERLELFLRRLPRRRLHAIEFRDPSWYTPETTELLRRYRVALCLHDMEGSAVGPTVAGPFGYLRLHGPQRYGGSYPERTLRVWAEWCAASLGAGQPVYVYFNNDTGGHAPRDADRLREACTRLGVDISVAHRSGDIGREL